jgi:hypothetical protein
MGTPRGGGEEGRTGEDRVRNAPTPGQVARRQRLRQWRNLESTLLRAVAGEFGGGVGGAMRGSHTLFSVRISELGEDFLL